MESDPEYQPPIAVELTADERWYDMLRAKLPPIHAPESLRARITAMLARERALPAPH